MTWKNLIILIGLLAGSVAHSQKYTAGLNFQVGIPQGEFRQVNDNVGVGGRFHFLYKPSANIPLSVGAELGYQVIGSQSRIFGTYTYGFYDEYRVTAANNILSMMFMARFSPLKSGKAVLPFIDGMFGWNDFFSTVSVERITFNNSFGGQNTNSSKARWAAAYGGSAGMDIRLDKSGGLYLELKTSYLVGNKSKYLTDPVFYTNGSVGFTQQESRTNMLIPQAGVRFVF